MVLDNYWIYKAYMEEHSQTYNAGNTYNTIGIKNLSGTTISQIWVTGQADMYTINDACKRIYDSIFDNHALRKKLGIRLGEGTTDVASTDYCLDDDVTSSFTNFTCTYLTSTSEDNGMTTTFTVTGNNQTGSTITINEIGVYKDISYFPNMWGDTYLDKSLFVREVLSEPVEVNDGQSFTIIYQWNER